jgi:hypothetical protein
MGRSSICLCGLALGLAACSSRYDPSGSYQGEAGSIVENFKPSTERAPYGESFKPVEVKSLGATFTRCASGRAP